MIISVEEEITHHKQPQIHPPYGYSITDSTCHPVLIENIPGFSLDVSDTKTEIMARR
ncbi:Uncharacterised protein [Yersinia massiliensis]|uniref:Uncharacterized protein n=1 Tax=Yersinia intermedia TaxID=631 RepID=A0A0H5LZX4_YERIN|nr:Uncharacterised protein [Yersinia massiliensis]CRY56739.1 Uncharacterised protein [Yersinia intermedia]